MALTLALYFSFFAFRSPGGKTVTYVPYRGAPQSEEEFLERDSLLFYAELKERLGQLGYTLNYSTLERPPLGSDYLIVINQKRSKLASWFVSLFPKGRKIALIFEPPIIEPKAFTDRFADQFSAIYYMTDRAVDGGQRRKLHFPHRLEPIAHWPQFEEKQLCTLVAGNHTSSFANSLYAERANAIAFFEESHPDSFGFYGRGWSEDGHPCYLGSVDDKLEAMSHFRFSICYENSIDEGNLTEKIFDSMCAGCVPVYWGDPQVTRWVPSDCFIDRTAFETPRSLFDHLASMEKEEYEGYLARIRAYLAGEKAQVRSKNSFVGEVAGAVLEMAARRSSGRAL